MGKMADLREAISATLTMDGVQESPYILANPTPPCAEVEPQPIQYDLAMQRGLDEWMFTVRVFVSVGSDAAAQKRLDAFIDPVGDQSVKTLIEADRTLGGTCDSVQVTKCSGYRTYTGTHSSSLLLGAEWTVKVLVSN